MSALPSKADVQRQLFDVRLAPEGDLATAAADSCSATGLRVSNAGFFALCKGLRAQAQDLKQHLRARKRRDPSRIERRGHFHHVPADDIETAQSLQKAL